MYLNLGCGNRFIEGKGWVNFDFVGIEPFVQQADLTKGIPVENDSVDFLYHSHVLEHFSKESGVYFISECFRVLKKGGILRVVVPDLEQLVRQYIKMLDQVLEQPGTYNQENYEWSVIELIDQMVRDHSGGQMVKYWKTERSNDQYIEERLGHEYRSWKQDEIRRQQAVEAPNTPPAQSWNETGKKLAQKIISGGKTANPHPSFRDSGEIHKWMYDRHSLKILLQQVGFGKVLVQSPNDSLLNNWSAFNELDIHDGRIRKPDSIILEGVK